MISLASFLVATVWGLLALRIALAAIFLVHGKQKLAMWKMAPSEQMPASMLTIMKILSIVETLAGISMLLGFFTRLGALAIIIVMLGALYFKMFKWKTPFNSNTTTGWEFDLIILASGIMLFFTGGGVVSFDLFF